MLAPAVPRIVGRYAMYNEIAAGGMAVVHLGRFVGEGGFARAVAIKRLHPAFARAPEFVDMFLQEARVAARIHHPNVVSTRDVVAADDEVLLVLDYVHGESLAQLLRAMQAVGERCPPRVVAAIVSGVLHGLHAAHEVRGEDQRSLQLVHRDVSPQNVLVCEDGVARVLDFGIAKALGSSQHTREGELKGKLPYMAPEVLQGEQATRQSDVYAAAVVLWESLVGRRLFVSDNESATIVQILQKDVPRPSELVGTPVMFDKIIERGLAREPKDRYATALEMARDLDACERAAPSEVGAWVRRGAALDLDRRAALVAMIEQIDVLALGFRPSAPPGPPSRGSAKVFALLAGALLVVGACVAGVLGLKTLARSRERSAAAEASARASTTATTETAPEASARATVAAAPPVDAPPVDAPPVDVPPVGTPAPSSSASARARPSSSSSRTAAARVDCDPPWTYDAAGRVHYKIECLKGTRR